MALSDFLKQNGYRNLVPQPLTFKLTADTNVRYPYAKIETLNSNKPVIVFVEESGTGTVAVTKDYAFVSYARVWNATNNAYDLTSQTINFSDTSEAGAVSVTETLLLADAEADGIDTTGETGPTMQVTHNKAGWEVVSCVKEVIKGNEIVYDGSKAVTINLYNL